MSTKADLRYQISLDAEVNSIREASREWHEFVSAMKTGVGLGIGSEIVRQIAEIPMAFREAMKAGEDFHAQMENMTQSFRTLLGSEANAVLRVEQLKKFAAQTPYELPGVTAASRLLQTLTGNALASGSGLTMVGDMAAVADRPIEEVAMHVGRLYDGLRSGREAGRAAMELQRLGLMSGETRNKIEAMQKAGKSGNEVWRFARTEFERYAGEMERRSKTLTGRISTFNDAWNAAMAEMMAGAAGVKKTGFENLTKALEDPKTIAALREMGVQIAQITQQLMRLAEWAARNADKIAGLATSLVSVAKAALLFKAGNIVSGGLGALVARMSPAATGAAASGGAANLNAMVPAVAAAAARRTGGAAKSLSASVASKKAAFAQEMLMGSIAFLPYMIGGGAVATRGKQKAREEALALEGMETASRSRRTGMRVRSSDLATAASAATQASASRMSSGMSTAANIGKSLSGIAKALPYIQLAVMAYEGVKDVVDNTNASREAAAKAEAEIAETANKTLDAYTEQVGKLGSVEEKQQLVAALDESINQARAQAKGSVDERIVTTLTMQAKALEIVREKVLAVTDAELNRREQATIAKQNTEANQLTLDTRDAEAKANAVRDAMAALKTELDAIETKSQRAQVNAELANPSNKRAGKEAERSGLDAQISTASAALAKLKEELAGIVLDKSKAPALFEADLKRTDDLKKAIPELQQMLDGLEIQKLRMDLDTIKEGAERINRLKQISVPSGIGTLENAGKYGTAQGFPSIRSFLGLDQAAGNPGANSQAAIQSASARESANSRDIANNTSKASALLASIDKSLLKLQDKADTAGGVW